MLIKTRRTGKKKEGKNRERERGYNNNKKAAVKRPLKSWLDF